MADNYLERKFEEHLRTSYPPATRRYAHRPTKHVVVLADDNSAVAFSVAKQMRIAGHNVTLVDNNRSKEDCSKIGVNNTLLQPDVIDSLNIEAVNRGPIDFIIVCMATLPFELFNVAYSYMLNVSSLGKKMVCCVQSDNLTANDVDNLFLQINTAARSVAKNTLRLNAVSYSAVSEYTLLEVAQIIRFLCEDSSSAMHGNHISL